MTTLTIPLVLLIVVGASTKLGYDRALAFAGAPVAGAAVVVGETAVPSFYFVAIGAVFGVAAITLRVPTPTATDFTAHRAKSLPITILWIFFAWCSLLTVTAPLLLDGQEVIANGKSSLLRAGTITTSNIAQVIYLLLGVVVAVLVFKARTIRPQIVGISLGGTVILSLWRYGNVKYGVPFPEGFFDNSPTYSYIETEVGGGARFRGILTEPAGLAGICLTAISYFLARFPAVSGGKKVSCVLLAGAATFMGFESTSATFVVAGAVIGVSAAISFVIPWVSRRVGLSIVATILVLFSIPVSAWALPQLGTYVERTVDEKEKSSSFDDRGAADNRAYEGLAESGGLGTGLGTSRGSAFLPNLLSTTGFVGATLFLTAVALALTMSRGLSRYRAVAWALFTALVLKGFAGPDLSDPSGVLWLSIGLLARGAWEERYTQQVVTAGPSQAVARESVG